MPHVDARNVAISSGTAATLAAFERSLARLLDGDRDATGPVDDALANAPGFAMGHALKAGAAVLADTRSERAAAARAIRAIERIGGANERERRHAAAARAWLGGDAALALARYGDLVADYPCDLLALRVAHTLDFRLGHHAMLRDRVAKALTHWNPDMPGYGQVLALHAFGLEETGDYDAAEAAAHRSLLLVAGNSPAIHVLAHVCEMRGRAREGIALLERTRSVWESNAGFARHMAWHLALFHADLNDTASALALYDAALAPCADASTGALVDASALLWRLELRGMPLRPRWRKLARCWKRQPLRGARAFNVVHAVIAHAGAHAFSRARRTASSLFDTVMQRVDRPHDVALAAAFCAGLVAFAEGRYGVAVARLRDVQAIAEQCGGSVAQCDLIHLTLIEAAHRGRRDRLARALATERAARRPGSRLHQWLFARTAAAGA